jgi:hypothetical protein
MARNVETSKADINKVCPEMIAYFGSGVRCSMFDLALLHAAARAQRILLRGRELFAFDRQPNEPHHAFLTRVCAGVGPYAATPASIVAPTLAVLQRGDIELPEASSVCALFREQLSPNLSASDLLS